jgi:hypothetical protein
MSSKIKDVETITVSGTIPKTVHEKLVKLANADDRSLKYIIAKACVEYANNHNINEEDNLNSN